MPNLRVFAHVSARLSVELLVERSVTPARFAAILGVHGLDEQAWSLLVTQCMTSFDEDPDGIARFRKMFEDAYDKYKLDRVIEVCVLAPFPSHDDLERADFAEELTRSGVFRRPEQVLPLGLLVVMVVVVGVAVYRQPTPGAVADTPTTAIAIVQHDAGAPSP
jgi:hypothetical protein